MEKEIKEYCTDEERKALKEFMHRVYKPYALANWHKDHLSEGWEKKEYDGAEWCSTCGEEIHCKMSFDDFRPIYCPVCNTQLTMCSLCSSFTEEYCELDCPSSFIYRERLKNGIKEKQSEVLERQLKIARLDLKESFIRNYKGGKYYVTK